MNGHKFANLEPPLKKQKCNMDINTMTPIQPLSHKTGLFAKPICFMSLSTTHSYVNLYKGINNWVQQCHLYEDQMDNWKLNPHNDIASKFNSSRRKSRSTQQSNLEPPCATSIQPQKKPKLSITETAPNSDYSQGPSKRKRHVKAVSIKPKDSMCSDYYSI